MDRPVVISVIFFFVVGFLTGYFTSPRSNDSSSMYDSYKQYSQKRRKELKKNDEFHPKLYESLNAKEFGDNLRSNDSSSSDDSCKQNNERRRREQKKKEEFHQKLYKSLNAKEIGDNLRYFSKRPHLAGTPRSKELANEIEKRWREYGFDKVEQPKYNVLLPYVSPDISNKVQILLKNGKVHKEFSGKEKLADSSEDDPTMIAPLLAYAKPGVANGALLYVNYGRTEDFDFLKNNLRIPDCNGKIVIMRYGKIFRGDKIQNAELCGADGAILYNDPADFAPEGPNKTYPNGVWLPKTGVQRGSIIQTSGDPLTPGLPSVDGVFRIPQEKANLPKIPATPMPYGDAINILRLMEGDDVPDSWKGNLSISYKLGNKGLRNNTTIKIEVNVPNMRQDIYNVIGTIYGKEEPDRWVLFGNHRDAWGFGAVDASSGTATVMEVSRSLKDLLKSGWRPRRTIKFCSWGAEESGLIGSTEWVEENERVLSTKAVTYINIDISVAGNYSMGVRGSPLLETVVFEVTKKIEDPHLKEDGTKKTMYERMLETSSSKTTPEYGKLPSGSDYAAFYQFVGVPSVDMRYDFADQIYYPVYHSVHDTYKWLQGLIDPNFAYHLSTGQLAARLLMDTADNIVLPLNVSKYGTALKNSLKILTKTYGAQLQKHNVTLKFIEMAVQKFSKAAENFEKEKRSAMDSKSDIALRDLNDRMVNVEKAFIYPPGLPSQPYIRHLAFAPPSNNRYGTTSFPGISDLLYPANKTEEDWEKIKGQISIVFKAISEATAVLSPDRK